MMTQNNNQETPLPTEGTVSAHPKGFGFLRVENGDDLFIPPPFMKSLVPGDRVKFRRELNRKSGQFSAAVEAVLDRPETFWLGELETSAGQTWLRADEALTPRVRVHGALGVKPGDVVQVQLPAGAQIGQTTLDAPLVANLGPRDVHDFDVRYAMAKWRLPVDFTSEQLAEAYAKEEPTTDRALALGYADLTHLPFVTIDGESTRDFDDAVCFRAGGAGSTLWVAIADVSHYVQPGSALDAGAMERGTSVYLPDRVLPMLPPALSTGLCSLNPQALRFALVCEMQYDGQGRELQYEFKRAIIRSHARLTYGQVSADNYAEWPQVVATMMAELKSWFALQLPGRKARGLMEYRNQEPKLSVGADGAYGIEWLEPLDSHALVEECMLAANRAAAQRLKSRAAAMLFRHQDGLDPEKWEEVVQWLGTTLGMSGVEPTLLGLQNLLGESIPADKLAQLAFRLRRSMVPAIYDHDESSHFSLGFAAYTHFTSPIRRYADLLVHRMLLDDSYEAPDGVADRLSSLARRAKVSSRFPWERLKRRLLWESRPGEMVAQVVGQSPRSCRVAVQGWDVLSVVPSLALESLGLRWDDESRTWKSAAYALDDGMLVKVRPSGLLDEGPTLELESQFIGVCA